MASNISNGTSARLNYALRLPIYENEKPYRIVSDLPGEYAKTNVDFQLAPQPETIHDLRGKEDLFNLDSHGFQIISHDSTVTDWSDRATIESVYIPEAVELYKKYLAEADEVYVYNWRKRKNRAYEDEGIKEINLKDGGQYVLPAGFVHVDISPATALSLVYKNMGDRADELVQGRVRMVNLWRSIGPDPILDAPLALCDGSGINREDYLTVDHVRNDFASETLMLVHRPGFKWHYLSKQSTHECYFIKNFDSLDGVEAENCPHTSFVLADVPPDHPPRESIEMRALVFTYA